MTPEQRRTFDERGLVRIPGVIARADAAAMADALWRELARRHAIRRGEPRTWTTERPAGFASLQSSGAFKPMASPRFVAILDDLLGRERWSRPRHWGQPLVCFPRWAGRWDVPHQTWHLDFPADPRGKNVGRLFAILAPLEHKGGGTLVATGSHRIVQRLVGERGFEQSSGEVRKRLKARHRWFAQLMSRDRTGDRERIQRFMHDASAVDDVELRVEEMTGEPGDVFVMHPAALHAAAPNTLEAPRLVLAQFVLPKA
jgi:hypothetical protein